MSFSSHQLTVCALTYQERALFVHVSGRRLNFWEADGHSCIVSCPGLQTLLLIPQKHSEESFGNTTSFPGGRRVCTEAHQFRHTPDLGKVSDTYPGGIRHQGQRILCCTGCPALKDVEQHFWPWPLGASSFPPQMCWPAMAPGIIARYSSGRQNLPLTKCNLTSGRWKNWSPKKASSFPRVTPSAGLGQEAHWSIERCSWAS